MTQQREAYAWQEPVTQKWCLSVLPVNKTNNPNNVRKPRPYNQYDTQAELITEAGRRGLKVVWTNG